MSWSTPAVRAEYRGLEPRAALDKAVSILLGVSTDGAAALADVGVLTVFDLATATLFGNAVEICRLAEDRQGRFADTGRVPRDVLRKCHDRPVAELPLQPIDILASAAPEAALTALATVIGASSVRDLAAWPPYQTSRQLLSLAFPLAEQSDDPATEAPADLVPANGQYPTERVQYEVLLFDQYLTESEQTIVSLAVTGPIDVSTLIAADHGYTRAALGAVLTYTQSWYTKGLALGNLIHSVALGPGESTRIAMIDWSRRTRATVTEEIGEQESLVSDLSRARAITEITSAVAKETQQGQSAAQNFATVSQQGESTGRAGIADPFPFGGLSPGVETGGTTRSSSTGTSLATAWSTSSGRREVAASLAQDIVDRTHQASHVARSRRASIVREVSQEESESVSTRTLTNYNHMHALTIEYYEVVQLYRAVVELTRADRCLFVPLRLVDFTNTLVVQRYKQVLAAAGLTGEVRALALADPGRYAFWAPGRSSPWDPERLTRASKLLGTSLGEPTSQMLSLPLTFRFRDVFFDASTPFSALTVTFSSGETVRLPLEHEGGEAGGPLYNTVHIALNSWIQGVKVFGDRLGEVRRVNAEKREDSLDFSGDVRVNLFEWSDDPGIDGPLYPISFSVRVPKDVPSVVLFQLQPTPTTPELTEHLQENRLYYSQAIWQSLDAAVIGSVLSGIHFPAGQGGKLVPLVQLVDPTPVTITANYLVLRLTADQPDMRSRWLKERNIVLGRQQEDLVPVPSGGVFAEAVLGRFNSAEKLDLTRFWNWQDSPPPITAPEIAPISTGSRGEPDDTKPGQLGAPILNILNSPALPDPQGMASVLAAVQNGAMFRDMSGLAATIGLAQAGLASAQQGATEAGAQAGQNAAVAAELGAKVAELAAKVVAAYFTGGASLAAGAGAEGLAGLAGGISGQGAKVNHGRDMDRRGLGSGSDGAGDPATGGVSGSGGASQNGSSPTGSSLGSLGGAGSLGAQSTQSDSSEVTAFQNSLGRGGGGGGFLGQILKTAQGAAPVPKTATATDTSPGFRACCALGQWVLGLNGELDPLSLSGHQYGKGGPTGYVYTAKAGLIDLGHIRDLADMTKFVFDSLVGGARRLLLFEGEVNVHAVPRDRNSIADLAGAIAYVESWAHELTTWGDFGQDLSSFSPEDIPSNIIGIEVGKRAVRGGGSYDAAVDSVVMALVNGELKARPAADTKVVLNKIKDKWFKTTVLPPFLVLLRRNFDGAVWRAGMPYDEAGAIGWLNPATFEPFFGEFSYRITGKVDGKSGVSLATMKSVTSSIRTAFVSVNPGMDKP